MFSNTFEQVFNYLITYLRDEGRFDSILGMCQEGCHLSLTLFSISITKTCIISQEWKDFGTLATLKKKTKKQ